jgi:catechol 2,3-dioxygenase-like lactoylglutathione lyase family enzyme
MMATMKVSRVLETCLYVDDLEAAELFYREVLGLELFAVKPGRHVFFTCGEQMLLLFDPEATSDPGAGIPGHGCFGRGHVAFDVDDGDRERWKEQLAQHGVEIEREVDWPGGARSIYFRDPAGNSLELASRDLWFDH